MTHQPASTAPLAAGLPLVHGKCPACRGASLFLGDGGYVTCSRIDCPEPDAASTLLEQAAAVSAAVAPPTNQTAPDLPAWEALYEPGNVSTYLIGYANDQDAATGMAEAWMRSQAEVTGRLEWVDDERLATGRYDRWFELVERHGDGVDTGTSIVVRRRMADETATETPTVTVHAAPALSPAAEEALGALIDVAKQQAVCDFEHPHPEHPCGRRTAAGARQDGVES